MLVVEILSDADSVLSEPLAQVLIAYTTCQYGAEGRGVGVLTLVLLLSDVLRNEAPLGVCAGRVLRHGIHVHTEAVAYAPNAKVLVKRILVAILGQHADIPFTVGDLVLARCVVGYIGVAHVLNMAHHAIINGCYFYIGFVIRWDDLTRWAVLPLLVRYLTDVLWQFVDCQTWARVDCLTLHCAASSQYVRRPLPLVVGRACHKAQIV